MVLLVLAMATLLATAGPVYQGTEHNLRVELPRLEAEIVVDGHLSEPVWQQAATRTSFSQYSPDDGPAAADPTEVLVWRIRALRAAATAASPADGRFRI